MSLKMFFFSRTLYVNVTTLTKVTSLLESQPGIVETLAMTETNLQSRGLSCNSHGKDLLRETVNI